MKSHCNQSSSLLTIYYYFYETMKLHKYLTRYYYIYLTHNLSDKSKLDPNVLIELLKVVCLRTYCLLTMLSLFSEIQIIEISLNFFKNQTRLLRCLLLISGRGDFLLLVEVVKVKKTRKSGKKCGGYQSFSFLLLQNRQKYFFQFHKNIGFWSCNCYFEENLMNVLKEIINQKYLLFGNTNSLSFLLFKIQKIRQKLLQKKLETFNLIKSFCPNYKRHFFNLPKMPMQQALNAEGRKKNFQNFFFLFFQWGAFR